MENQACRLHSFSSCTLCHYDGTYSLDIEDPTHQAVISNFLAKSRKKNNRELMYERINERRNIRKKFIERIRGQPRGERRPDAADEILVLSSDDEDYADAMMRRIRAQLNPVQMEITPEPGTVQTSSHDHASGADSSLTSAGKRLFRTRLGITMPIGTPGTMTASVNYTASAGDSEVTYVSSGAGRADSGAPIISSLSAAMNSSSTSGALTVSNFLLPRSTHAGTEIPARTTDVNNSSSPGMRNSNYSGHWLSQTNSSTANISSPTMTSICSRISPHHGAPAILGGSDIGDVVRNTAALMPRLRASSATVPNSSRNTYQAKSSTRKVSRVTKSRPKAVKPSALNEARSSGKLLHRTPQVAGNISDQQTSQSSSVNDLLASELADSLGEEHTIAIGKTMTLPPPLCYKDSGNIALARLCNRECSEGSCSVIPYCTKNDCPTSIPSTSIDGVCEKERSLIKFLPAQNSQQGQVKTCLPEPISLVECLQLPMDARISSPSSGKEPTSSSLQQFSIFRKRAPYRLVFNNSRASFSKTNRGSGSEQGSSASSMPLAPTYSGGEKVPLRGKQKSKDLPIPVEINAWPEKIMTPEPNLTNSSQTNECPSPDEVVESYLTKKLSSATAPMGNVGFSSGSCLDGDIPYSSLLNPTQAVWIPSSTLSASSVAKEDAMSCKALALNWGRNPLSISALPLFDGGKLVSANAVSGRWNMSQSSNKRHLESEEPPLKRLRLLPSPNSISTTIGDSSIRALSGGVPPKRDESIPILQTPAAESSHSLKLLVDLTSSIQPALDGTEHPVTAQTDLSKPILPTNASLTDSILFTNDQPDQPLPPFENITGDFHSQINNYQIESTSPADPAQFLNETKICLERICEWLLACTSEPLLPMLLSMEYDPESAAPAIQASGNEDINGDDDRNCEQPATPKSTEINNCRKLKTPNRKVDRPKPKTISGKVRKRRIPPIRRSEDFLIRCEGYKGFKVNSSILERASPVLKDFANKCGRWYIIDGVEYRTFDVIGVTDWAMHEIIKFICHDSYNHNFMRTSHMKRLLDMLQIKYKQRQTFIFPDEPDIDGTSYGEQ